MENGIFKETACKVALELGYSKKAIIHCYQRGMRAGDLVSKIIDLEETNPNQFNSEEINSEEELSRQLQKMTLNKDIESLRKETFYLWQTFQCHSCWKYKSTRLALPCTHLVTCENCISDKCIICKEIVTDWIKIHM